MLIMLVDDVVSDTITSTTCDDTDDSDDDDDDTTPETYDTGAPVDNDILLYRDRKQTSLFRTSGIIPVCLTDCHQTY
jgi:hypothetical protein